MVKSASYVQQPVLVGIYHTYVAKLELNFVKVVAWNSSFRSQILFQELQSKV